MIAKDHKNTIFAVVITILVCGCAYFATNDRTSSNNIFSTKELVEVNTSTSTIHPFTHCLSVAMSEARQSGNLCTIKEAKSICRRLQEPANYKKKKNVERDEVKE